MNDSLWRGRPYDLTTKMFGGETFEQLIFPRFEFKPKTFLYKFSVSKLLLGVYKVDVMSQKRS